MASDDTRHYIWFLQNAVFETRLHCQRVHPSEREHSLNLRSPIEIDLGYYDTESTSITGCARLFEVFAFRLSASREALRAL
jgi:hypothetical protein